MAYTISTGTPRGQSFASVGVRGLSMERIVRPFDRAERILQRVIDSRPPERDDSETDIRWGAASRFQLTDPEQPTNPSVSVQGGINDPEEEPEQPPYIPVYTEIDKKLEAVRIENPDDPEQYVDTKRRIWSLMQRDDGTQVVFAWDNSDIDN